MNTIRLSTYEPTASALRDGNAVQSSLPGSFVEVQPSDENMVRVRVAGGEWRMVDGVSLASAINQSLARARG